MKILAKVFIVIGFLTVVACIAGAILYTYRNELPHKGLLATESTQNNTSSTTESTQNNTSSTTESTQNNTSNDTSPLAVHSEPKLQPVQEVTQNRTKREIIYVPVFIDRQQEIYRKRYRGPARRRTSTTSTTTPKPKYASRYTYDDSSWLGG